MEMTDGTNDIDDRFNSNIQILILLLKLMKKHEHLRFNQALILLGVSDEDKGDRLTYYEESTITLNRILKNIEDGGDF